MPYQKIMPKSKIADKMQYIYCFSFHWMRNLFTGCVNVIGTKKYDFNRIRRPSIQLPRAQATRNVLRPSFLRKVGAKILNSRRSRKQNHEFPVPWEEFHIPGYPGYFSGNKRNSRISRQNRVDSRNSRNSRRPYL